MNIEIVANTNQLPGFQMIAVQNADPERAQAELISIAKRKGYTLGDKIYQFAKTYFYAVVESGMK